MMLTREQKLEICLYAYCRTEIDPSKRVELIHYSWDLPRDNCVCLLETSGPLKGLFSEVEEGRWVQTVLVRVPARWLYRRGFGPDTYPLFQRNPSRNLSPGEVQVEP